MANPTMVVEINSWSDPDTNDGNWPFPTQYKKFLVSGDLADRIRSKAGAKAESAVYLTEEVVSGGYSEYTQENDMFFKLEVDGHTFKFDEYMPRVGWDATAAARLSAWLDA